MAEEVAMKRADSTLHHLAPSTQTKASKVVGAQEVRVGVATTGRALLLPRGQAVVLRAAVREAKTTGLTPTLSGTSLTTGRKRRGSGQYYGEWITCIDIYIVGASWNFLCTMMSFYLSIP